jgi:hypothetical protein
MNNPENPFGSKQIAQRQANAVAESDQQRAIAETQAAMVIAKRFPRDQVAATDRILQACARPTLAEQALYSYSRGGTDITGPSIRLAEMLAQNWGNMQFGIRELEQRNGESSVEAMAWDVETNTKQVKVFQVPHIRYSKAKGNTALSDPRDIYELVANQGARRLRACILGVIPGDVIEAAVKQCEVTLATKAEVTPEKLASLVEMFGAFGVTRESIEKRIQRHLESMTPALMVQLGKIYNSLKDGMSAPADWFDIAQPDAAQSKPETGTDALRSAVKKPAGKKPDSPPPPNDDTQLFAELKRICAEAVAITDAEVAFLRLDDARFVLTEISDTATYKEQAQADIDAAQATLEQRSAAAKREQNK